MTTTIDNIPSEEFKKMRQKVVEQLNSMSDDELEIALKSKASLAKTIALLFQNIAKLMGYMIAYPILLATKIAESLIVGFGKGLEQAFKDIWED